MAPKEAVEKEDRPTNRFLKMFSFKNCCTGKEAKKPGLLVRTGAYPIKYLPIFFANSLCSVNFDIIRMMSVEK